MSSTDIDNLWRKARLSHELFVEFIYLFINSTNIRKPTRCWAKDITVNKTNTISALGAFGLGNLERICGRIAAAVGSSQLNRSMTSKMEGTYILDRGTQMCKSTKLWKDYEKFSVSRL